MNVTLGLKTFSTSRYNYLKDTLSYFGCYPATVSQLGSSVSVAIYPNPGLHLLKIDAYIRIYNVVGHTFKSLFYHKEKEVSIFVADLPTVIYSIEINKTISRRLIRE